MELKGRLELIAKKIPECNILCDIGTDHAYIPIYIMKNTHCKKVIATDIKEGPIIVANRNIYKNNLQTKIETRLSDGLNSIKENEIDVIVISGIGGLTITQILTKGLEKVKKAKSLIVQPMNSIELVREWLYKNGFNIYDEELIFDGHKIYNVILSKWENQIFQQDEIYYYIGEKLIENKSILLKDVIKNKISLLKKNINEMKNISNKNMKIKENQIRLKEKLERFLIDKDFN